MCHGFFGLLCRSIGNRGTGNEINISSATGYYVV